MSLPDIIGPISPDGDDMNGIFYHIRQTIPDPISSGIIKVSASEALHGNPNDIVSIWNINTNEELEEKPPQYANYRLWVL